MFPSHICLRVYKKPIGLSCREGLVSWEGVYVFWWKAGGSLVSAINFTQYFWRANIDETSRFSCYNLSLWFQKIFNFILTSKDFWFIFEIRNFGIEGTAYNSFCYGNPRWKCHCIPRVWVSKYFFCNISGQKRFPCIVLCTKFLLNSCNRICAI